MNGSAVASADLDRRICLDVFFAVAPKVGDGTGCKICVITNNSRTPTRFEKFWQRAFSGLVDPQCCNEGIAIKCRYVHSTGDQRHTLHHDWPIVGEEQTLASG